jgi:hypothetical protein
VSLCTGLSAFWCPNCGDCTCQRAHDGDCCFDNEACPLHGKRSHHAETVELEGVRERISEMAAEQGVELTANDHEAVSRFAQYLCERHRSGKRPSAEAERLRKLVT